MYYPIWQHPNASTDESKVTEYEELLELVREHPVCCDCGSEDPPSTWIVTATDNCADANATAMHKKTANTAHKTQR